MLGRGGPRPCCCGEPFPYCKRTAFRAARKLASCWLKTRMNRLLWCAGRVRHHRKVNPMPVCVETEHRFSERKVWGV